MRVIGIEPRAQGVAALTVIDEVPAYYAAADGEVTAFTRVRRQSPAVLDLTISENLIQLVNNRYAVQFSATLAIAGDYRGATITAAHDDGPPKQVAMADGAGAASWVGPASGRLASTAVPGAAGIPAGAGHSIVHEIQGNRLQPADVVGFLITCQSDGTREFSWRQNEEDDIAGYKICYAATVTAARSWPDMLPLHEGLLTESPWEVNRPGGGSWTFAIKAVNFSGHESNNATFITAELAPARLGPSLAAACPAQQGWPGTLFGEVTEQGGASVDNYSWAELADVTWAEWAEWRLAPVNSPATAFVYVSEVTDFSKPLQLQATFSSAGPEGGVIPLTFEVRADPVGGHPENYPWEAVPAGLFTARSVQLRWRSAGSAIVQTLCWEIHGPTRKEEHHLDANTANWPRGPHGGRLVPSNLDHVTGFMLTLQSTGAGWTAVAAAKNPPEVQIFNAAGDEADGIVDITLSGI